MSDFRNTLMHLDAYKNIESKNEKLKKFSFNVFDELHADENAHTRILVKLLSYPGKNKEYPFLKEFFSCLNEKLKQNNYKNLNVFSTSRRLEIKNQKNNIDCIILDRAKDWAIIIENKIENAKDQDKQLERYFYDVKNIYGIKPQHIFVVYLTADSSKTVSEKSLSLEFAQKNLNFKNVANTGRFIRINYQDDIFGLLERMQNNSVFTDAEEPISTAGLKQYVDYFTGRFGIREWERRYYNNMKEDILSVLQIQSNNKSNQLKGLEEEKIKFQEAFNIINQTQSNIFNDIAHSYKHIFSCKKEPFNKIDIFEDRTLFFSEWYFGDSLIDFDKYFVLDINFNIQSVECKFFCRKSQNDGVFYKESFTKDLEKILKDAGFRKDEGDFAYRRIFLKRDTVKIYDSPTDKSMLTAFISKLLKHLSKLK